MKVEIDVKFATTFQEEVYSEAIRQTLMGMKYAMHGSHKKNKFNFNILEDE